MTVTGDEKLRAITDRLMKATAYLDDFERDKLRLLLFFAGHKWGQLSPDEMISAFEMAGFKIMTDDALRRCADEQHQLKASDI